MCSVEKNFKKMASRKIESYFIKSSNCQMCNSAGICLRVEFMGLCLFSPSRRENSIIPGYVF